MLRRLASLIIATYGRLPGHRGKWRVVDWLQGQFGLHHNPVPRTAVAFRAGFWWDLDLRWYMDRTIYFLGEHETPDTAWVISVLAPGAVVIDVGANIGWYTLHAARSVGVTGSVHAFEPNATEAQRLEMNVRLNRLGNVTVNRCAVDDHVGTVALGPTLDAGATHLATGDLNGEVRVPSTTLDAYALAHGMGRVDLLKVDVEGVELRVLRGAGQLLLRFRPYLLVELSEENLARFGTTGSDLLRYLTDMGYVSCRMKRAGYKTVTPIDADSPVTGHFNVIAVPQERWPPPGITPSRSTTSDRHDQGSTPSVTHS